MKHPDNWILRAVASQEFTFLENDERIKMTRMKKRYSLSNNHHRRHWK